MINETYVETYFATVYCGLRIGYTDQYHKIEEVESLCQKYCDKVGLCVTVTATQYIYVSVNEPGVAIGLINYPRFPLAFGQIFDHARVIGMLLLDLMGQNRITIVTPDRTVMYEKSMIEQLTPLTNVV